MPIVVAEAPRSYRNWHNGFRLISCATGQYPRLALSHYRRMGIILEIDSKACIQQRKFINGGTLRKELREKDGGPYARMLVLLQHKLGGRAAVQAS